MSKALILIDYINDICHPDGKIAGCAKAISENNIVAKVNQLTSYARSEKWLVIWVKVAFSDNYIEANSQSPIFSRAKQFGALQLKSWGSELLADLDYDSEELVIVKNAVNPFYATNLDYVLRLHNIDEVFLAGVSTEVAIQSCTRDAHDRGYRVNVIGDCCASREPKFHQISLEMLQIFANVTTSSQVIDLNNN